MTDAAPELDPKQALHRDAVELDRKLKRKHRALYNSDPKSYREIIRAARAQVTRQKPGPKPKRNDLLPKAARERGRRAPWRELYPRYIPGYNEMNPVTREYAEDGFRNRVNEYLRNHPRLKLPKRTPDQITPPESAP
jgi:hypothetical protein